MHAFQFNGAHVWMQTKSYSCQNDFSICMCWKLTFYRILFEKKKSCYIVGKKLMPIKLHRSKRFKLSSKLWTECEWEYVLAHAISIVDIISAAFHLFSQWPFISKVYYRTVASCTFVLCVCMYISCAFTHRFVFLAICTMFYGCLKSSLCVFFKLFFFSICVAHWFNTPLFFML